MRSERPRNSVRTFTLWQSMIDPKVLLLSLNYLGIVTASLGMLFFIPQIIKSIGVTSNMTVGWLTMVPYICGGIGLVVWGFVSDRMNERRWNLLLACIVSTAGLVMAGMTMGTWWALVGMSIAAVGFYGSKGPFWAMPPMFLTGTAAAAGIAWINSIGNLGGFFGPWYVGVMKDATGSFSGGLYGLALLGLISAFVCAFFLHIPTARVWPAAPARASESSGELTRAALASEPVAIGRTRRREAIRGAGAAPIREFSMACWGCHGDRVKVAPHSPTGWGSPR